jgi:rhodanese-related sulfurtransferase
VVNISPEQLADVLSKPNAHLIDVRDPAEWDSGHLDGSQSVPLEQFRADPEHQFSRDATLVFICAKGNRSLAAAKLAERLGYESVYNVSGGTAACARVGFQLVTARVAA